MVGVVTLVALAGYVDICASVKQDRTLGAKRGRAQLQYLIKKEAKSLTATQAPARMANMMAEALLLFASRDASDSKPVAEAADGDKKDKKSSEKVPSSKPHPILTFTPSPLS